MCSFVQRLKRLIQRKTLDRSLQSFERQQEKFRQKYPNYTLGIGTYGMPKVHDDEEGTTLRIGAFCSISSEVQIFLGKNHRVDWISSYPFPAFFKEAQHIEEFGVSRGDVTIGSDVWLCANCIILSGVTIGHGAVIGAGAVVSRDVAPYSIVAGNPAKHVRWRFEESIRQALLATAWWDWPEAELRGIVEILCSDRVKDLLAYANQRKRQLKH
jgi:acetyltransferase-like isoleucine patch superfamily enzyme